ncbi:MAG: Stp1/IreP family PP2C-type Ser/Thr phosphatase [Nitrospirae bacterium]|nr:Stp1/IreP family PP2C-type Ser/Thr phosphatase [Nitrospirota bacterium]
MRKRPQSHGLTHVGMKRSHNEDTIFFSDDLGLYLVADGMGGHAQGEVASALAVETITEWFSSPNQAPSPSFLKEALKHANHRIYQYAREKMESQMEEGTLMAGMGTTVVALQINHEAASIAHAGDSRAYRMRDSHLEVLTQDHSLVARAAAERNIPHIPVRTGFKNIITRALGIEPDVEVDIREETLQPGDLFLLCSDGLTNMVPEERIQEILNSGLQLQSVCRALVDEANLNGGRDNISCVLVRI